MEKKEKFLQIKLTNIETDENSGVSLEFNSKGYSNGKIIEFLRASYKALDLNVKKFLSKLDKEFTYHDDDKTTIADLDELKEMIFDYIKST